MFLGKPIVLSISLALSTLPEREAYPHIFRVIYLSGCCDVWCYLFFPLPFFLCFEMLHIQLPINEFSGKYRATLAICHSVTIDARHIDHTAYQ
jgi:hypothetical protein